MANEEEREPEVLPDAPEEENQEEKETQQTEEAADESKESETEKSENQKEIETLQAQKEHWRKKAQDLERKSKSSVAQKTEDTSQSDDEFRPRVEFLLENRDLNADEYDHLAAVALRNSGKINLESLREAKKSEAEYIGYLRKKAESKSKLPGSTSAS